MAAPSRPNFIVILADDQAESTLRFMPRVDRLTESGVTFTDVFATNPVCGPARASLMLGRYAHNHGVHDNLGPGGGIAAYQANGHELSNLATWLQASGYRTGLFGKYLNGYGTSPATTYVPPGWTEWCAKLEQGVGYFDFSILHDGITENYTSAQGVHELEALGDAAIAFLAGAAAASEPFFLWFSPFSPHAIAKEDPPRPPAAFDGIYAGMGAPRGPAFNEADVSDKPPWLRKQPLFDAAREAHVDLLYAKSAEVVAGLDAAVGELLDAVERLGLTESTYVFYSSDNGFQFGEHRLVGKGTSFEEAVQVPLIISGPGVQQGMVRDELAANIDLAPTIVELAGVVSPAEFDGRSLVPLFAGVAPAWRQAILLENWRMVNPPVDYSIAFNWRALRTRSYKITEYGGPDESYDLARDIFELDSLLAPSASPPPSARDVLWLEQLACCQGFECRALENDGPLPVCDDGDQTCLPVCSTLRLCGDVTGDNQVSISDARKILVSVAMERTCLACRCDLDGDGAVSVRDALQALIFAVRGSAALNCPAC